MFLLWVVLAATTPTTLVVKTPIPVVFPKTVPIAFPSTVPVVFPTTVPVHVDDSLWTMGAVIASCIAAGFAGFLAIVTANLVKQTSDLAQETARMADGTVILANATRDSIAKADESIKQTKEAIDAEERHHRQSLQTHVTFRAVTRRDRLGRFDGYTVQAENIGPGYAWGIDVTGDPIRKSPINPAEVGETVRLRRGERLPNSETRLSSTRPTGLRPGAVCDIAIIADNMDGFEDLQAIYFDVFRHGFRSFVPGNYKPGENFKTEFEPLP